LPPHTFSGNDPKTTLVLNFYAFSRRKNTCPIPTMTANSAAGDPFPRFYLGTHLASTPKDDEAPVFQVPFHRSAKISTPAWYGTNHAVAAGVENFPSRPHDNRRHDTHHSSTTTSAPTAVPTLTYACNNHEHNQPSAPLVSDRHKFDLEAFKRQVQRNLESLQPLNQFLGMLPETSAGKPNPDHSHKLPTGAQEALTQAVMLTLGPSKMDLTRPPTSMQPTTCSAATTPPQQTTTATPTAVQNLHTISPTTPTVEAPTTNPVLTTTDLRTMTPQHHRQQTMTTTVPPTTPTSTTTMTDTQPPTTPPTIVIDFSEITTFLICHNQNLDHLKKSIQRLSQTMAKTITIADDITRLIQQTTDAQIAAEDTSNPTFPSPTPSNDKPSYTQQPPATLSLNSIQSPRIPAPPIDPNAIPTHPTDTSDNNNTSAQWSFSPCPATPAPPFLLKHMIANMRQKPQPSCRFLTMLSRMAKNNYWPP